MPSYTYCPDCDQEYVSYYFPKHLETQKHLKNVKPFECDICYSDENKKGQRSCEVCKRSVCCDCEPKLSKCPFCRNVFYNEVNYDDMPPLEEFPRLERLNAEVGSYTMSSEFILSSRTRSDIADNLSAELTIAARYLGFISDDQYYSFEPWNIRNLVPFPTDIVLTRHNFDNVDMLVHTNIVRLRFNRNNPSLI